MKYFKYFSAMVGLNIIMLMFGKHNEAMLIWCVGMSLAYLIISKNIDCVYFFLSVFFFGVAELTLVDAGIWTYGYPQFMGVPYWMPLMWGLCTGILKKITDLFVKWRCYVK